MSETGHIGVNTGVWGVVTGALVAALLALPAPWWVWAGALAWLALWLTALLGLSDGASRGFLAGTLRKSTYTQIYTTLTRRNVMGLWRRLCDPADDRTGLPALFRAALSWRLAGWVLLIALVYTLALTLTGPGTAWSAVPLLAALTLVNALFDALSVAATLALLRHGLRTRFPLPWAMLDLAVACLLFLALGAALVAVIRGLSGFAGVPILDLGALLAGLSTAPGDYWWLYAMLFSTILPTALHFAVSLAGLQGVWPRAWRRPVAGWIEAAPESPAYAVRAALALGLVWTVPLLLLGGALWALWAMGGGLIRAALARYLDWLVWIAGGPVGAL